MKRPLATVLLCFTAMAAGAQPAAPPEPILRVSLDSPRTIVGQKTTLAVEVLAPNYMTKPPVMPDFQLRNAVTRAGSTINMSEQRDGISYAGVRFEFLIYPQEPGSYALDGQKISVTFATEPPATREAELSIPHIAFEAFVPDSARTLDPFVSAMVLKLRQEVQRSSEALKVGDAITRTATIEADGTLAMLLPPTAFAPIAGTKLYPAQPLLQDTVDRRTDRVSSTRTDQATYMLERPGEFSLPAIEVAWWNVREQKIERVSIEPVDLHVADNPLLNARADSVRVSPRRLRSMMAFLADHWLTALVVLAALAVLARVIPGAVRAVVAWSRRRRAAYQASEHCAFAEFRAAARIGDAKRTYFALLGWLQRFEPAAPTHTIGAFKAAAHTAELNRQIAGIERRLFANEQSESAWVGRDFSRQVANARRGLMNPAAVGASALPTNLNPQPIFSKGT